MNVLLLKQFLMHHYLTQDVLSDLLGLLSIYSPADTWPATVYLFNKHFQPVQNAPVFYFCSDCFQPLPSCKEEKCLNTYSEKRILLNYHSRHS